MLNNPKKQNHSELDRRRLKQTPYQKDIYIKKDKTLKRQSNCHVFVKQVCFSYGEGSHTKY